MSYAGIDLVAQRGEDYQSKTRCLCGATWAVWKWRGAWLRNYRAEPPTLQEATRWIDIMVGFQGRKVDGHPGVEVLWHGLKKLHVAIEMYLIYHPAARVGIRFEYPPWFLPANARG